MIVEDLRRTLNDLYIQGADGHQITDFKIFKGVATIVLNDRSGKGVYGVEIGLIDDDSEAQKSPVSNNSSAKSLGGIFNAVDDVEYPYEEINS